MLFKIRHLGLSTYVGRFNDFDATLEFDPNNMSAAKLSAVVDMSSVDINDQEIEVEAGTSIIQAAEQRQMAI